MDGDVEMTAADGGAAVGLDDMKKRLKEMEDEAAALREMQAKVEQEMGAVQEGWAMATAKTTLRGGLWLRLNNLRAGLIQFSLRSSSWIFKIFSYAEAPSVCPCFPPCYS
ncbi:hypothetical protein OROGR_020236 [Orobanche gracilis]